MNLPLVVEMTFRHYMFSGSICALLLIAGVWIVVQHRRGELEYATALSICIGLGVVAACFLLPPLFWRFQVTEAGMAVRAPFDVFEASRQIDWKDLRSVEIRQPRLRIRGKGDDDIELSLLNELPAQFGAMMVTHVCAQAPQAQILPDIGKFLAAFAVAHKTDGAGGRPNRIALRISSYVVRSGGRVLDDDARSAPGSPLLPEHCKGSGQS